LDGMLNNVGGLGRRRKPHRKRGLPRLQGAITHDSTTTSIRPSWDRNKAACRTLPTHPLKTSKARLRAPPEVGWPTVELLPAGWTKTRNARIEPSVARTVTPSLPIIPLRSDSCDLSSEASAMVCVLTADNIVWIKGIGWSKTTPSENFLLSSFLL